MIDEVLFLRHGRTAYNLVKTAARPNRHSPRHRRTGGRRTKARTNSPKPTIGRKSRISPNITTSSRNPRMKGAHLADIRRNQRRARREPAACSSSHRICSARSRPRTPFADLHGAGRGPRPASARTQLRRMGGHDPRGDPANSTPTTTIHGAPTPGGETKHGVESRSHTGRAWRPRHARSIIAEHARRFHANHAASPSATDHGSWPPSPYCLTWIRTISTIVGAMRNAFWTRMSVDARRGPSRTPTHGTWKLDAFNQGPAIAALTPTGRMGPKRIARARTCRCGSPSCSEHAVTHGGPLLTVGACGEHEFSMKSPACAYG